MNARGPSSIVHHVYHEHINHFGEPDECITFDEDHAVSPAPDLFPAPIDILVWHPSTNLDITTFSTIGMCDKPMVNVDYRAELHFAVRRTLPGDDVHACGLFLANLATYPFHYGTHLDWWHKVRDPGAVPVFSNARSVLLYPRFVDEGWDHMLFNDTIIKLLNVIPISAEAYNLKSRDDVIEYVWDQLEDPFTPW